MEIILRCYEMIFMPSDHIVRYFGKLHRLALDQAEDLQPALGRIMECSRVGSPSDIDFKTVSSAVRSEDRTALWRQIQLNCLHMAVNVGDHVRALALLLSQPDVGTPIYAHATVARVAIESATSVAYILDRAAAFDLRFARGIAQLVSDSDAARRTAYCIPANTYMAAPEPQQRRTTKI
jgi:hypothetical protein